MNHHRSNHALQPSQQRYARLGYHWMLYAALLLSLFVPRNANADADQKMRQEMSISIANAWQNEDFAVLESMQTDYLDSAKRTPSGKRLLALFETNITWCISIRPIAETLEALKSSKTIYPTGEELNGPPPSRYTLVNQEWDKVGQIIDRWERKFPNSPHPKIAKAIFYTNKGAYFRGTRWAHEVHKEAWPIYRENYDAAKKLLRDTQAVSRKNPMWFSLMLEILSAQSAPRSEIDALLSDTLENGQGYPNALQSAFHFMQPRWGGSYEKMEEFARLANEKTHKQEHGQIYARLYWNMVTAQGKAEMDRDFFSRTKASWPLLQQSFDLIVKDHPVPRNLSGYALFACMANDRAKAKQLLSEAQTLTYYASWPQELRRLCPPN